MQLDKLKTEILQFNRAHGRAPSQREIGKLAGYSSTGSIGYAVDKLIQDGFLKRDSTGKVGLRHFYEIPMTFIGTVHAGVTVGFPNPSEEETSETMTLEQLLTVDMHAAKLFKVQGDSMIEAGILQDDILLVECTDQWEPGDIVLAEIDGEETVKYIRKDKKGKPYLEAANKTIKDIYPHEYLKVKAVIKNVIRPYGKRTKRS